MAESSVDEILKYDPALKAPRPKMPASVSKSSIDEILQYDPVAKPAMADVAKGYPGAGYFASAKEGEDPTSWRQAIVTAFQNIPKSAGSQAVNMIGGFGQIIKGAASLVTSPVETAKKVKDVDYGALADSLVETYKTKYGSIDAFRNELAKDPVGVLSDISTLTTGAGGIVQLTGKVGQISKLVKAGEAIAKTGAALEPVNVARGIAALPLKLVSESIPVNMYQSAVKFTTTLPERERFAITKTALQNQIMPTTSGMAKLRGKIDDFNEKVNDSINNSFSKGHPISVDDLFKGLDTLKDDFKRISDEPLAWEQAFKGIKKQYNEAFYGVGPARSLEEVQKIKTRIYKDLESFYEKQKASPAKVELRKAVARNARESLEVIIPEIKELNKAEGALIELWDAVESKANRISNRDLISIGLPVKMGAGAMIGGMVGGQDAAAVGTALGFALGVFDTPQVKAKVALVLDRLREKGITVKPTTAAVRLGLVYIGKEKSANQQSIIDQQTGGQ